MGQAALVVGAIAVSAVQASMQNSAARKQAELQNQATTLNLEQQRTAEYEKRAIAARNLRQRMAEQIALTSKRGGSSSLMGQFAAQSMQNYAQDIRALSNQTRMAEASAQNAYATSAANVTATRNIGFGNILSTGMNAYAMSSFGNTGATDKVK